MDKKIAGLLGAVGALASLNGAQAATSPEPSDVLKAQSYADLLKPIPNALEVLNAADSEFVRKPANFKSLKMPTTIITITVTVANGG